MSPRLLTTLGDAPEGFDSGAPRRRDVLGGTVALLVRDERELDALFGDVLDRLRGVVIVPGAETTFVRRNPLLWSMTADPASIGALHATLVPFLDAIDTAATAADRTAELEFISLRTSRELETTKADYARLTNRLSEQIRSLTETQSLLQTSERAVRKWSQRLEERVEERTADLVASNAALKLATDVAEKANEAKGKFLATMSHEIRTPLSGVLGVLELLTSSRLDANQGHLVESARTSAGALLEIVDQILDASKLDAGRVELESVPIDLLSVVETVCETLCANALRKGVELHCHIGHEVPTTVLGDPLRFRQVLFNLCSNAIKFTSTSDARIGRVFVDVRADAASDTTATIRVEVKDNGVGIDAETVSRLFVPFAQAEPGTSRRFGGTGLGLAICKELVELMNGSITVTSEVGRGSEFVVEVPFALLDPIEFRRDTPASDFDVVLAVEEPALRSVLADYAASAGATVSSVDDIAKLELRPRADGHIAIVARFEDACSLRSRLDAFESKFPLAARPGVVFIVPRDARERVLPDDSVAFAAPPVSKGRFADALRIAAGLASDAWASRSAEIRLDESPSTDGPGAIADETVLVVEDDATNREVLSYQLRRLGIGHVTATDGHEALRVFGERPIALVITDCHMPGMDGIALTRALRAIERDRDVRIPILALSASADPEESERCLAAGMDGCFRKPIDFESLGRAMRTWLPSQRAIDARVDALGLPSAAVGEFDPTALARAVGGSSESHPRIIRMFLESAGGSFGVLERALGERNRAALAFEAHKLRSSSLTIGALAVGKLCETIERSAANEPEWTRLAELVVEAEKEFVRVTPTLVEWTVRVSGP